jgi:mono/diheme cytochrome c family protein
MKIIKISLILLALAGFFAACTQTKPTNTEVRSNTANVTTNALPATPVDELASGRKLYADNCAICHKDNGTGGKTTVDGKAIDPASLASESMKKKSDEKLARQISDGAPDDGMPAFKAKLSEAQIKDVVNYVRHGIQKM